MLIKTLSLLVLTVLVSGQSQAALAKTVSCTECTALEKETKEFKGLDYTNKDDRSKGDMKVIDLAEKLEKFGDLPKKSPQRAELFNAWLSLVAEAGPYDGESQLAQLVGEQIHKDATLKASYESFIKSLTKTAQGKDVCKLQRMETSISEATCHEKAGTTGQDDGKDTKTCVKPFSYETCLKEKSAKKG